MCFIILYFTFNFFEPFILFVCMDGIIKGLLRCGKSCRLRWMNYLRPGIKRGNITADEEDLIIRLQSLLGNSWSLIAGRLPGRTDNEIKNHWNTHLVKRLKKEGIEPKKSRKPLRSERTCTKKDPKEKKTKNKKPHNNTPSDDHSSDHDRNQEVSNNNMTTKTSITKPTKLCMTSSSSFGSLGSGNSNSSFNQEEERVDREEANPEFSDISWSSFELDDQLTYDEQQRRIDISDENEILLDGDYDLSFPVSSPMSENMLDKVYDEYLRLL